MELSPEAQALNGALIRIPDRAERCYMKSVPEANMVVNMFADLLKAVVAGKGDWLPGAGVLLGYDNVKGQAYAAFVEGIDPSAEVSE